MKVKLGILVLLLGVVGCATFGTDFDWVNVEKLQVGMTTEQVRTIMGPPTSVTAADSTEVWKWLQTKANFLGAVEGKWVQVPFANGLVSEVPAIPSEVLRDRNVQKQ